MTPASAHCFDGGVCGCSMVGLDVVVSGWSRVIAAAADLRVGRRLEKHN
jgi:hypothetical protein